MDPVGAAFQGTAGVTAPPTHTHFFLFDTTVVDVECLPCTDLGQLAWGGGVVGSAGLGPPSGPV